MGAIFLSDSKRAALRPRSNKSMHPLFKLLAALSLSILFLAVVVWTGDRNKSTKPDVSANQSIDKGAAASALAPVSPALMTQ
jgi:hypothetical protein